MAKVVSPNFDKPVSDPTFNMNLPSVDELRELMYKDIDPVATSRDVIAQLTDNTRRTLGFIEELSRNDQEKLTELTDSFKSYIEQNESILKKGIITPDDAQAFLEMSRRVSRLELIYKEAELSRGRYEDYIRSKAAEEPLMSESIRSRITEFSKRTGTSIKQAITGVRDIVEPGSRDELTKAGLSVLAGPLAPIILSASQIVDKEKLRNIAQYGKEKLTDFYLNIRDKFRDLKPKKEGLDQLKLAKPLVEEKLQELDKSRGKAYAEVLAMRREVSEPDVISPRPLDRTEVYSPALELGERSTTKPIDLAFGSFGPSKVTANERWRESILSRLNDIVKLMKEGLEEQKKDDNDTGFIDSIINKVPWLRGLLSKITGIGGTLLTGVGIAAGAGAAAYGMSKINDILQDEASKTESPMLGKTASVLSNAGMFSLAPIPIMLDKVIKEFPEWWSTFKNKSSEMTDVITSKLSMIWNDISERGKAFWDASKIYAKDSWEYIQAKMSDFGSFVKSKVLSTFESLPEIVKRLPESLSSTIQSGFSKAIEIGKSLTEGAVGLISDPRKVIEGLVDRAKGVISPKAIGAGEISTQSIVTPSASLSSNIESSRIETKSSNPLIDLEGLGRIISREISKIIPDTKKLSSQITTQTFKDEGLPIITKDMGLLLINTGVF